MSISHSTPVFISATHQGQRFWLTGTTNERHKSSGNLVLMGQWSPEPSAARSQTLETAVITRRRLWEESNCQVDFSLAAGSLDFVEGQATSSPGGPDERPTMEFRGLLIRPGIDVRSGTKTWFIRLRDPQRGELQSIKAESPQEAVQKIFERGLQDIAEKAPVVPPQPQQAAPARSTARIRPGSFRR